MSRYLFYFIVTVVSIRSQFPPTFVVDQHIANLGNLQIKKKKAHALDTPFVLIRVHWLVRRTS